MTSNVSLATTATDQSQGPRAAYLAIQDRAWIFLVYSSAAYIVHGTISTQWIPAGIQSGLWFVSVIGLLAFRLLASPFFARPKDTFVSALTGAFVLWALDLSTSPHQELLDPLRWLSAGMLGLVAVCGFVAVALGRLDTARAPRRSRLARACYHVSVEFGRGEIVFTPSALIGALGFKLSVTSGILLTAAWVVISVTQPLERGLRAYRRYKAEWRSGRVSTAVGTINRIDDPGIVRVSLVNPGRWATDQVLLCRLADDRCALVLPLFRHLRNADAIGTGLLVPTDHDADVSAGSVITHPTPPNRHDVLMSAFGGEHGELVGFVVEGSTIGGIRFEVAADHSLQEGHVAYCQVSGERVAYQIADATTAEESFERNPRGTVVVTAVQLGKPTPDRGFDRCLWTPLMNAPVYTMPTTVAEPPADRFTLGFVPGTDVWIDGAFEEIVNFHAAVLGVTGTGKTEFVFDIIREGLARGAKVACVDFTEEYVRRLADCGPSSLGFTTGDSATLAEVVEAVETGEYGGAAEKGKLNRFLASIRPKVATQVSEFLETEGAGLGVFALEDIANTRSTLRATELYLSEIFAWARKHRKAKQILVVLEEAHTVIPESNLFGFDRNETLAVIGRISQIALQGRKYGVGLLVVSQRTALVSKTILSQCGTVAAFSLVDKTSLEYLHSIFDADVCRAIPRLPPRRLVVTGPGVVTERPVILDIPYDPAKAAASAALDSPAKSRQ